MNLKYATVFGLCGLSAISLGVSLWGRGTAAGALLPLLAVSFLALSMAYGLGKAGMLLKQRNGRHSILGWAIFGPYFLMTLIVFTAYRLCSREPASVEIAPDLWFGRRLSDREAKLVPAKTVIDLAGEIAENPRFRRVNCYHSLPILDATPPSDAQLSEAIRVIAAGLQSGPVYVHCALGHGRTGCVIIAYLVSINAVPNVQEGIALLRFHRPGVGLHPEQLRRLERFLATLKRGAV